MMGRRKTKVAELTQELQIAIRTALDEAQHRHHEFAGTEHLLLALFAMFRSRGQTLRRQCRLA